MGDIDVDEISIESVVERIDRTDLHESLLSALQNNGISSLTPIQIACLPHGLANKDILAKAKTGTGKI